MPSKRLLSLLISSAIILPASQSMAEDTMNRAAAMELPTIEVISATPLPGIGVPIEKYAGNIQTISAEELENQNATELSEMLFRHIGSVDINSSQNNPFQNDTHYRGFLASPLVGSAIGISTYIDGVRVNESFGDTVNWDLIPEFAIANVALIPGSNPLFGLNTLGGALSVQTKSGFNFQGTNVGLSGGSDGRNSQTVEHGGNSGNFDWYVGANKFNEDGWRQRSPSDVKQFFAKVGWETETTDLDLSYSHADNDLIGNGFVPESHLDVSRSAVYTFPDQTENEMHFFNLNGSHWISDSFLVSANAFYRDFERKTLNGDAELECVAEIVSSKSGNLIEVPIFTNGDAEDRIHNANCETDDIPNGAVIGSRSKVPFNPDTHEAELEVEGEERNTLTETDTFGGTLQFSYDATLGGRDNTLVFGASYDKGETHFRVSEAEAELFQEGISYGTEDAEDQEIDVDIDTEKTNWALFLTDTIDMTDSIALTLAGRYQHSNVKIQDLTGEPENQDLNGSHNFSRFNPAVGLTYSASDNLTVYGAYNESFRTPTAAELTCADPDDPCNLPNSFVADPPLDPVIGKTLELGLRGKLALAGKVNWNAAVFRTKLEDDLLFTTISSAGAGFFQNIDETRRQGVELGLSGAHQKLAWFANYSYIDATFESDERLASVVDPNGVFIKSGDTLPAIPEHNFKLGADYAVYDNFHVGATLNYASDTYMRGDESNQLDKISSHTVVNLNARYAPNKQVQIWTKVDNVFDKEYNTSGIRNFSCFTSQHVKLDHFSRYTWLFLIHINVSKYIHRTLLGMRTFLRLIFHTPLVSRHIEPFWICWIY